MEVGWRRTKERGRHVMLHSRPCCNRLCCFGARHKVKLGLVLDVMVCRFMFISLYQVLPLVTFVPFIDARQDFFQWNECSHPGCCFAWIDDTRPSMSRSTLDPSFRAIVIKALSRQCLSAGVLMYFTKEANVQNCSHELSVHVHS